MTGHIDPTKETFAAFRASDQPGLIRMAPSEAGSGFGGAA